jgi:hypothetical protein
MAASTVAIARMTSSRISRPDTGLRRPQCARRLAGEAAASAAAEEEVVEHVIVAYVHAGGSRIRRAVPEVGSFHLETSLRRVWTSSLSACSSAGMSECRIIRKQKNIAAAQAAAGNTANRNLKGTS